MTNAPVSIIITPFDSAQLDQPVMKSTATGKNLTNRGIDKTERPSWNQWNGDDMRPTETGLSSWLGFRLLRLRMEELNVIWVPVHCGWFINKWPHVGNKKLFGLFFFDVFEFKFRKFLKTKQRKETQWSGKENLQTPVCWWNHFAKSLSSLCYFNLPLRTRVKTAPRVWVWFSTKKILVPDKHFLKLISEIQCGNVTAASG